MREERGHITVVDECHVPLITNLGYNRHSPDCTGSAKKVQNKFERSLRKFNS